MEEIDACIVGFVLSCTTLIGPLVEKNRESISFCGLNLHGQSCKFMRLIYTLSGTRVNCVLIFFLFFLLKFKFFICFELFYVLILKIIF